LLLVFLAMGWLSSGVTWSPHGNRGTHVYMYSIITTGTRKGSPRRHHQACGWRQQAERGRCSRAAGWREGGRRRRRPPRVCPCCGVVLPVGGVEAPAHGRASQGCGAGGRKPGEGGRRPPPGRRQPRAPRSPRRSRPPRASPRDDARKQAHFRTDRPRTDRPEGVS